MPKRDFGAAKLQRDAQTAGEAFGFDDATIDEGHTIASTWIMWCFAAVVGFGLVLGMYLS